MGRVREQVVSGPGLSSEFEVKAANRFGLWSTGTGKQWDAVGFPHGESETGEHGVNFVNLV